MFCEFLPLVGKSQMSGGFLFFFVMQNNSLYEVYTEWTSVISTDLITRSYMEDICTSEGEVLQTTSR